MENLKPNLAKGPGPHVSPDEDNGGEEELRQAGGAELLDTGVVPHQQDALKCVVCGRVYVTRSGLARHRKTCGVRDRTHCAYCGKEFATFPGVRQHERKAHPEEFMAEAEAELPPSNARVFTLMAEIEVAKRPNRPFLKDMVEATGLTIDQVRYRRTQPAYRDFLNNYRPGPIPENPPASQASLAIEREPVGRRADRLGDASVRPRRPIPSSETAREVPSGSSRDHAPRTARVAVPSGLTTDRCQPSTSGLSGAVPRRLGPPVPSASYSSDSDDSSEPSRHTDLPESAPPPRNTGRTSIHLRSRVVRTEPARPPDPAPELRVEPSLAENTLFSDHLESLRGEAPALTEIIDSVSRAQPEELVELIDQWIQAKFSSQRRGRRGGRRHSGPRNYGQTQGGRGPRAAAFKKAQDLWQKSRSAVAEAVLGGTLGTEEEGCPTVEDVETLYGGIFESASPPDEEPLHDSIRTDSAFTPVTVEEVEAAKRGWSNSAPGLDGIGVAEVRARTDAELAALFTVILWKGIQPASWGASRTVLIHKDGDRREASNWRPITISSALQRLWHRVLSRRLRQLLALNLNQRGFVGGDGTMANATILDNFIKSRTEQGCPFSVVSLDIRKAFDTVSHNSVERALRRFMVDERVIRYVMGSLANSTTTIKVGRGHTRGMEVRRGVKQGDPLSPLLFNLVVDELLEQLNGPGIRGAKLADGVVCAAMAFADDLILMDEGEVGVPNTLAQVEVFLRARGMQVNPNKSVALCVAGYEGRAIPRTRPSFKLDGKWLKAVGVVDSFRYLGHRLGFGGIERPNVLALQMMLERTHRAPLKPDQKLHILKQHVIPRLLYGYQNPKVTAGFLRKADRLVRRFVKRALHLNIHTPDALIHARIRDGGLGVTSLRYFIPSIYGRRLTRLSESTDPVLVSTAGTARFRRLLERITHLAGHTAPGQLWRERLRLGVTTAGLLSAVGDSVSSAWLGGKPMGWTGRDFVKAVQLRTENLPVVGVPSNPPEARRCRGCHMRVESLSHVLQRCPVVHGMRIRRHDEICRKIFRYAEGRSWEVEWEPHVRHPDGTLFKPDLFVRMDARNAVIVDVQVSWESADRQMPEVWEAKRLVYDNPRFRDAAARRWPGVDLAFTPVVLGARGFWPRCNQPAVEALSIPVHLKASCVHTVLKWGPSIHAAFMRAVWA